MSRSIRSSALCPCLFPSARLASNTAGRDARVMVSNTSGNTVEADIFLDFAGERHAGAPLTFKPHETKILSISKLLGDLETSPASAPEGGITVIPRGAVPALIAQGKIMDVAKGFSTTLDFPLPEVQRTNALHATGVPIGLPSKDSPYAGTGVFIPHVIVRNMTSAPQSVVITLEYPGEKEPQQTPLAPLALGPYATEDLSLDSAFGLLPLPLPFCSIGIQYSGPRGSVIAQVSSIEEKGDLVIDSRVANEGDGWAGSGGNPWHLDAETESILFLTNLSDRPAPIGFHVQAHGVHYYVDDLRLEPHETRAIDLRKLRDAQKPDFHKNKIPADATDGSVVWVRIGNVAVMGQMVVLQRHKGLASNYHCSMCQCGSYLLPWALVVTPSGATINVNSSRQFDATASYVDCYGNVYPLTGHQGFGWWPDPPGVATVSANGYVTGVSGGTTTINALFIDCGKWQYDYFYDCCNCKYDNSPVGATPLNVKAKITSISAPRGLTGVTTSVTISGNGFGTNPTVNAGTGITVTRGSFSDTQIQASFAVASNAPSGNHAVTVSTAQGTSNSVNFYVQIPSKVVRFDYPGAPGGVGPLQIITDGNVLGIAGNILLTHQCGVYRNYVYDVVDQAGQSIDGTYTFTYWFSDYQGPVGLPSPHDVPMTPNSLLTDNQFFGKPAPACLGPDEHESFKMHHYATTGGQRYDLTTVITVSKGRFSGEYRVDAPITTP